MKRLQDLTEAEADELVRRVTNAVQARLPPDTGFVVLLWPGSGPQGWGVQIGSNAAPQDVPGFLRGVAGGVERWQDVPR